MTSLSCFFSSSGVLLTENIKIFSSIIIFANERFVTNIDKCFFLFRGRTKDIKGEDTREATKARWHLYGFCLYFQLLGNGSVAQVVLSGGKNGDFFTINFAYALAVAFGVMLAGGVSGKKKKTNSIKIKVRGQHRKVNRTHLLAVRMMFNNLILQCGFFNLNSSHNITLNSVLTLISTCG
jgi:hypothetical protein